MRFSPGCRCCGDECGTVTGVVHACCVAHLLEGATVLLQLDDGAGGWEDHASTLTASDGSYTIPFTHAADDARVVITYPGTITANVAVGPVACGAGPYTASETLQSDDVNLRCDCTSCNPDDPCYGTGRIFMPPLLYLSDGFGIVELVLGAGPTYLGCAERTLPGREFGDAEAGFCRPETAGPVTTPVRFNLECNAPEWRLVIGVPSCFSADPFPEKYYATTGPPCGEPSLEDHGDPEPASAPPTSCVPFALTLNATFDPFWPSYDLYGPSATFTVSE